MLLIINSRRCYGIFIETYVMKEVHRKKLGYNILGTKDTKMFDIYIVP